MVVLSCVSTAVETIKFSVKRCKIFVTEQVVSTASNRSGVSSMNFCREVH